MELLAVQKHLLRVLSFGGLIPFPSLLTTANRRGKCASFYVAYALTIHLVLLLVGVMQYHYPPSIFLAKLMDKTSVFVLFTGYLQWKIILPTIALHSVLNINKLDTFFNIIKRTGFTIYNQPITARAMIFGLVIILRITDMLIYQTHSWKMMCLRFVDCVQGLMFDFYHFHLYFQVLILRLGFRHVQQQLRMVLPAGNYEQIVRTLQGCDLLFKALHAFNDYYGLIMAEMCIIVFLRCSLTLYFVLILSDQTWLCFDVSYSLIYVAGWNTGIIIFIFHMLHNTSAEVKAVFANKSKMPLTFKFDYTFSHMIFRQTKLYCTQDILQTAMILQIVERIGRSTSFC